MRRPGSVDLILTATILIWAFNVTVTRYVLTHGFQPLAYGAIRYGAAAISRSWSPWRSSTRCGWAAGGA